MSKEIQVDEMKEEKSKKKAAAKPKKLSSAERARIRADEIREKMLQAKNIQPGTVIGGDSELYSYYHNASGLDSSDQTIAHLKRLGYERCEDGETMIGFNGGHLWRCPKEITDERLKRRASKK